MLGYWDLWEKVNSPNFKGVEFYIFWQRQAATLFVDSWGGHVWSRGGCKCRFLGGEIYTT